MEGAAHTEDKGSVSGPAPRKGSKKDGLTRPHVGYTPHPNVTYQSELAALIDVYTFVLESHKTKEAAGASFGEKGGKHDLREDFVTSQDFEQRGKKA